MIVLDTNVISETFKGRPDTNLMRWLDRAALTSLFLCWPVIGELRFGSARLPEGKRKSELVAAIDEAEYRLFNGRILSFEGAAAHAIANLRASRQKSGRPIHPMDALIASIARANSMALATRDTQNFDGLGIPLINPFEVAD